MKSPTCMLAGTMIVLALTISQSLAQTTYEPYTFTTFAGNAPFGSTDGTGSAARFNGPAGVAVDSAGNVYVADSGNHTIRKVTPAGVVTTLAGLAGNLGSADGTGSAALFYFPAGVALDAAANVYVADQGNHTIRKVTPAGVVTTLAGLAGIAGSANGTGSAARFDSPSAVAVDSGGNAYVADRINNTIRKVTPAGVVTTLAGHVSIKDQNGNPLGDYADGTGNAAGFNYPSGVAVDSGGNVYVADQSNHTVRKVTPAGAVTTLAGVAGLSGKADGTGSTAQFSYPRGMAVDSAGNVYVADSNNYTIRKVTPAGVVTTLAGLAGIGGSADGTESAARFNAPESVAVDTAGNVYVADEFNNTIRKVTPDGVVTTLAGLAVSPGSADGTGSDAQFHGPGGLAVDSAGNVYVADTYNYTIRKVTPAGMVTTLAGRAGFSGKADGTGSAARFGGILGGPRGVAADGAGNIYAADGDNNTIRKVTPTGVVTTLAGGAYGSVDGTGSDARFAHPFGVAVDNAGNVYVADSGNDTIRKVTLVGTNWVVTTLAGLAGSDGSADGTGSDARFVSPVGVVVDSAGNVYVADYGNYTIRKVTAAGVVTTLAGLARTDGNADGTGSAARFGGSDIGPTGVAIDSAGNVYVTDAGNGTIRKVTPAGVVTTLAGNASLKDQNGNSVAGGADGTGSAAQFNYPKGVAVDSVGNVYVADTFNNTIRKGHPALAINSSGPNFGFNTGQFGFNLTGPTGKLVVVEASSDLVSWLPLWTNTFAGALNFIDPQGGVYSKRFYRAHLR